MFTRIQTRFFRCLKSIDQDLGPFRVLVGPNASGKTTFLDVIALLGVLVRNRGDVLASMHSRTREFERLLWMGEGDAFQLAVEADIPETVREKMVESRRGNTRVRYEIEIGLEAESGEIGLNHEMLWLMEAPRPRPMVPRELFPSLQTDIPSIFCGPGRGRRALITKKPGGNDNYYPDGKKSYNPSFRGGRGKSALANIPADEESFPVGTWFRTVLEDGVQSLVLNSQKMGQPSPPGLERRFQMDGSNLPWVIEGLRRTPGRFRSWLEHVRTALEDIRDIVTIEREEDRHRYLLVEYGNGAKVPSWLVSDGTLRLLALTIVAYLPDIEGTFLIEEPENGIHPRGIQTVLESISSMYGRQALVATHSPIALNMIEPKDVLCFAKDESGATDIVSGDLHPALKDWRRGAPDFGTLFASGILS